MKFAGYGVAYSTARNVFHLSFHLDSVFSGLLLSYDIDSKVS